VEAPENLFAGFADLLDRIKMTPAGTLLERADELRGKLFRVGAVFFVVFVGVAFFTRPVFDWLKDPLIKALPPGQATLHFTDPLEVFMCYIKVAFLAASTVTAPYFFAEIWRFIKPALPEMQRRFIGPFFVSSLVLFIGGGAFCFLAILPTALEWLLTNGAEQALPMITVGDYITLVVLMLLGFGLVFQLPVVLVILARLGVIDAQVLRKNRTAMLIGILFVSAVATPTPDPFSQIAMATPMYLLFEAAILVIRWFERQDARAVAKS
jgi:sec-independent protein translocase protein TatC